MKINLSFFSVMLFLSFLITEPTFALASVLAVVIHESAHIVAAKIRHTYFKELKLGIWGAGLTPNDNIFSYDDEIIICIAGPLVNFISSLISIPIYSLVPCAFIEYFIAASAVLGALNILPVKSFDGGRILHSILCKNINLRTADRILSIVSFVLIFVIWSLSVYLLLANEFGLSFFVFSISLFIRFFL